MQQSASPLSLANFRWPRLNPVISRLCLKYQASICYDARTPAYFWFLKVSFLLSKLFITISFSFDHLRSGIVITMMLSIRLQPVHSFVVFSVLGLSFLSTAASTDIPLEGVGIWNGIDTCAQSCAISASSAFSSLASCPTSNPASCICNVAPAVSAVAGAAHQCASTSCTAFPSYSADPERARAALTSYCLSNGIVSTGTIARAAVATSTSRESYPQEAAYRVA